MKSKLLKLTSVLSVGVFMVVAMFSTPAQAELVNANDLVVDAKFTDAEFVGNLESKVVVYKCFVYRCPLEDWLKD